MAPAETAVCRIAWGGKKEEMVLMKSDMELEYNRTCGQGSNYG
jgi:hypothetical protein